MRETRDNQRSRVYAWERRIKGYHRPPEWRTIDEVAAWLAPIWRAERGRYGRTRVPMPTLAPASWGQRAATAGADHCIKLPLWARQGPVVLHEAAHRLTPADEAHGPRFVGVLIGLLSRHLGYDAGELMALADEMGVRYHVRSIGVVPVIGPAERVRRAVAEEGPMTEMDIACWLDLSYLQVRGAAMFLIRRGVARWHRRKLTLIEAPPPAAAPAPKPRKEGPTVRDVAKRYRISIEVDEASASEGRAYWVLPPSLPDEDPFEGDHWAGTWAEVRRRVLAYAKAIDPNFTM